jgi:hypothetical protein
MIGRCPYCHALCDRDEPLVVCRGCLAAHHPDCWAELARCASCADARALRETAAATTRLPAPTAPAARLTTPLVLILAVLGTLSCVWTVPAILVLKASEPAITLLVMAIGVAAWLALIREAATREASTPPPPIAMAAERQPSTSRSEAAAAPRLQVRVSQVA